MNAEDLSPMFNNENILLALVEGVSPVGAGGEKSNIFGF